MDTWFNAYILALPTKNTGINDNAIATNTCSSYSATSKHQLPTKRCQCFLEKWMISEPGKKCPKWTCNILLCPKQESNKKLIKSWQKGIWLILKGLLLGWDGKFEHRKEKITAWIKNIKCIKNYEFIWSKQTIRNKFPWSFPKATS